MTTRCKFKCISMAKKVGWSKDAPFLYAFEFNAIGGGVPGDSAENKAFFAATPNGRLSLDVVRDDHFKVGEDYYLDFTAAPAVPA